MFKKKHDIIKTRKADEKTTEREKSLSQAQIICIEDLAPKKTYAEKIGRAIDPSFICELVHNKVF